MLDIEGLPNEIHQSIYSFIKDNWDRFIVDSRSWVKEDILEYSQERLKNQAYPESKSWLYLCLASTSNKMDKVKALLDEYENSDASIVATVVKDLKEKNKFNIHSS